ncbi:MAG: hypothetical protein A4E52_00423 [Pelotomaculum sp. PtaB.Bin013]|nr:MAG: hypothetical protein A4E52_00423 [Pelotomaculum sp. PtaB.Bin013]
MTNKRTENEKKFRHWIELSDGGRRYFYEIKGKYGWFARYIKDVDYLELTVKFCQEIYDQNGNLVEINVKYPEDKGHKKIQKGNNDESYSSEYSTKNNRLFISPHYPVRIG